MTDIDVKKLATRLLAGMRGDSDDADDDLQGTWDTICAHCEQHGAAPANEALIVMAPGLDDLGHDLVGRLAICCGALLEYGADPTPAIEPFLQRLPGQLELADRFCNRLSEHAIEDEEEESFDEDELEWFPFGMVPATAVTTMAAIHPDEAAAHSGMETFALGTIAMLSRSPSARVRAREHPEWADAAFSVGERFLFQMLQVLDDEPLLVLHPESGRGWRFVVGGVADNFQLNTLLLGALVGEGSLAGMDGERPSDGALALVRGDGPQESDELIVVKWTLTNWVALQPDGTVDSDFSRSGDYWIWNEGVPADIDRFEGTRTVLIGSGGPERIFGARRTFGGLPARFDHTETLPPDDVAAILARIRDTPRDIATDGP